MLLEDTVLTFRPPVFSRRIITIVGGYGSGKSEVSVNLACHLVAGETGFDGPVSIVDLDIVNPYFRSREAAEKLQQLGIQTIHPQGGQRYADLPIILPDIKAGIKKSTGMMVLDVGGDDAGARVLGSLADAFTPGEYDLLFVINANRPFTATAEGCLKTMAEIAQSSRLSFTGLISNTHLLEDTTGEIVLQGLKLAHRVSRETGLPVSFLCAARDVLDTIEADRIDVPVLPLKRSLLKPWEKSE